ncbi:LysR family transcriptional regulator [Pseudomonas hunanensis]|uniref:LysR family transcriptional regulator n=1 Tax=Pseudomonas hunanensis TaxID=1247546 RepID=A0ABD6N7Y8_9PSED|nr:LysR family transcriptional regulator [Pseudomonas hunanensis]NWL47471.1 LysR family transcriptional regulator [Pseudomonas hunanensis]
MNSAFNNLSISQLTALLTILELRNLSQAAIRLGTSQSGVSRHLAQFREAFADPLMIRQRGEYLLTERGEALVEPVKAILERLQEISTPTHFTPQACNRRFRLAGSDYVAQHILPGLLEHLADIAPNTDIDFRLWQPDRFDWLAQGELDLVTSMLEATPAAYHGRMIGEDRAICCMRESHPLANHTKLSLTDYLAWRHLKITTGGDKDGFLEAYLRKHSLQRNLRLSVPFYSAAQSVIESSDLLLMLPEHIASKWSEQGGICYRPLDFIEHQFRYWVVWHSRTHSSPEQAWFRRLVHTHCQQSQSLSPGLETR